MAHGQQLNGHLLVRISVPRMAVVWQPDYVAHSYVRPAKRKCVGSVMEAHLVDPRKTGASEIRGIESTGAKVRGRFMD